ncbi:MAG: adenosine-specific kinase [Methanobacterium sp.]
MVETDQGRGIIGIIDGSKPVEIESEDDVAFRKKFLREIGYKF